ncbi:hypothetical protein M885DRAFT_613347 [Pelagophyceae sp. CCMP2097]|nr:hypothetical protein M885DRAFT_613347 [Pelagophyceae sp. CCMP2097]
MWSRGVEPSSSFRRASSAQSDPLDDFFAMEAAVAVERKVERKASGTKVAPPPPPPGGGASPSAASPPPPPPGGAASAGAAVSPAAAALPAEEDAAEAAAHEKIRALRLQLADPSVSERVNLRLAAESAESVLRYYRDRPDLSRYTCEKEAPRNTYLFDGESATDAALQLRAATGDGELLVRLANQSVFADALIALSQELNAESIFAAVANSPSSTPSFLLRFGPAPSLEATLHIEVTVPTTATAPPACQSRVALATAQCSVFVKIEDGRATVVRRVERPRLTRLFDADTRAAATAAAMLAGAAPPPQAPASLIGPGRFFAAATKASSSLLAAGVQRVKDRRAKPGEPVSLYRRPPADEPGEPVPLYRRPPTDEPVSLYRRPPADEPVSLYRRDA